MDEDYRVIFGNKLRLLRVNAGLSQSKLAITVGFSRSQVHRLENGQRRPNVQMVRNMFLPALNLPEDHPDAIELLHLALESWMKRKA